MKIRNDVRLGAVLLFGDILAINSAFLFSYWLRFASGIFPVIYGVPHVSNYFKIFPILTVILIFLIRSDKLYQVRARLSIVDEIFTIMRSVTLAIIVFMAGTFLYREYSFSRSMLILAWVSLSFFMGAWRFFINRIRFYFRRKFGKTRNLLIIGDRSIVYRLISHILDDPHWDYKIAGVLSINNKQIELPDNVNVLGTIDDLAWVVRKYDIEEVILTETEMPRKKILDVILECEKGMVEFRLIADLLGMVTSKVDMRTIDGIPLLGLKETPLSEGYNRFLKRITDLVLSIIGIAVLSPLLILLGILVKISSPGPVFYLQKRIGEDGSRFTIFKFRTMINKAEKGTGAVWAIKNDPRRTGLGGFLRRTNLDELPQLFNVLRGEMSLVGPRPERPRFVGKFKENIPRYMARHKIKSGVTGWAQVNGLRGNTSIEERTKYDLYYIENWSLAFDLKIIFMSIFAMKNAY